MRRIYTVYLLKKVINPFAVKLYVFLAFVLSVSSLVSVPDIINNSRSISGINQLVSFSTTAFINTEFSVQILSVAITLVIIWMLYDVAKVRQMPYFAAH